ncbi:MAG: 1-phosphofructokinase family hexose kinase [Chloroflexota bacterium]
MLLAITPNPPLDRTLHVPRLAVGAVQRATGVHLSAGGKGLNVARVARLLGCPTLASGPLAGQSGRIFAELAGAEGIPADWYGLKSGETRTCLLINHDHGDATVINEPGPTVSAADWRGFAAYVRQLAAAAGAVAFAGSLPPGVAADALGALARSLATPPRAVYLDTSGPALTAALAQPAGLCLKVNRAELSAGLGLELADLGQIVEAGRRLLGRGAALVVVTMGAQGAVAVSEEEAWQATPPPIAVVSSVGSGDSFLAGLAVARWRGEALDRALALAVACGAANALTSLPGQLDLTTLDKLLQQVNPLRL